MELNKHFETLFKELEDGHLEIRGRLNAIDISGETLEDKLSGEMDSFETWRFRLMDSLGEIVDNFNDEEREYHQDYISRSTYYQVVQEAPFYWRIIKKPNGYPGDADMMNYIYKNSYEGRTPFGMFLHKHAVTTKACQSVRNRKDYLAQEIKKIKEGKILSLAAGPAQEIREVLENLEAGRLKFIALDHDMATLQRFRVSGNDGKFQYALANAFTIMSGDYRIAMPKNNMMRFCYPRKDFKGFRKLMAPLKYNLDSLEPEIFDLVYSAGLYDYIQTFPLDDSKGTVALTKNLFDLVKPGGSLIVGNFNYENPRDLRFVMEYIYDWQLIYRDEHEMVDMARKIPEDQIEKIRIIKESTGINYFLKIDKAR